MQEFLPQDSARISRDKLRVFVQKSKYSPYVNKGGIRNIMIEIPNISEDEELDKF